MTRPSVNDIEKIHIKGPWNTKSGGQLSVLFSIEHKYLEKFFHYDPEELSRIKTDIRGLRSYRVSGVSKGSVGANEWHKIRNEIVYASKGRFRWICTDSQGATKEFILDESTTILTPAYILHRYESLEDESEITVIANTTFIPDDPQTHDTFPKSDFPMQ